MQAVRIELDIFQKVGLAIHQGEIEIVREYLDKGIPVNSKDPGYSPSRFPDEDVANLAYGRSFLQLAVEMDKVAIVKLFIEKGTDCSPKNSKGQTPLHFVCSLEVFDLLIEAGARPSDVCDQNFTFMEVDPKKKIALIMQMEDRCRKLNLLDNYLPQDLINLVKDYTGYVSPLNYMSDRCITQLILCSPYSSMSEQRQYEAIGENGHYLNSQPYFTEMTPNICLEEAAAKFYARHIQESRLALSSLGFELDETSKRTHRRHSAQLALLLLWKDNLQKLKTLIPQNIHPRTKQIVDEMEEIVMKCASNKRKRDAIEF